MKGGDAYVLVDTRKRKRAQRFERHSNLMRLKPQRYSMSRTLKETGFLLSEVITISLEKHGMSQELKKYLM